MEPVEEACDKPTEPKAATRDATMANFFIILPITLVLLNHSNIYWYGMAYTYSAIGMISSFDY
ncbi:hypothetical protein BFS14_25875 [Serratia fonticola]|nr:hypothetical protein BFS14_25875 [Serratia fonticola]